jgi:hypothetical protein
MLTAVSVCTNGAKIVESVRQQRTEQNANRQRGTEQPTPSIDNNHNIAIK